MKLTEHTGEWASREEALEWYWETLAAWRDLDWIHGWLVAQPGRGRRENGCADARVAADRLRQRRGWTLDTVAEAWRWKHDRLLARGPCTSLVKLDQAGGLLKRQPDWQDWEPPPKIERDWPSSETAVRPPGWLSQRGIACMSRYERGREILSKWGIQAAPEAKTGSGPEAAFEAATSGDVPF